MNIQILDSQSYRDDLRSACKQLIKAIDELEYYPAEQRASVYHVFRKIDTEFSIESGRKTNRAP